MNSSGTPYLTITNITRPEPVYPSFMAFRFVSQDPAAVGPSLSSRSAAPASGRRGHRERRVGHEGTASAAVAAKAIPPMGGRLSTDHRVTGGVWEQRTRTVLV